MGCGAFHVFDAADPKGHDAWVEALAEWPEREVSADPAYSTLFASRTDRAICLAFRGERGWVLLPLLLRRIAQEPWAASCDAQWDATTPYGYGGPFRWGCSEGIAHRFWACVREWASAERVVSLFARLSLFSDQLAPFFGLITEDRPNIVRTLDISEEALWRDYAHKVRKNVNRARAAGLQVVLDLVGERLDDFLRIYYETLNRRGALPDYYFGREFFEQLRSQLQSQFLFIHVLSAGEMVSTELVLVSQSYIYSFLGGTRADAFEMRPNDLLKHELILWAKRAGKKAYVLGGGYDVCDGIFRYKLGFAPRGALSFRTGQLVFDQAAYDRLVAVRAGFERAHGRAWEPRAGYFPAYRA